MLSRKNHFRQSYIFVFKISKKKKTHNIDSLPSRKDDAREKYSTIFHHVCEFRKSADSSYDFDVTFGDFAFKLDTDRTITKCSFTKGTNGIKKSKYIYKTDQFGNEFCFLIVTTKHM